MKKTLYSENRIKIAEEIQKTLKKVLNEKKFIQNYTGIDNDGLIIEYKGGMHIVIVKIFKNDKKQSRIPN